MTRAEELAEQIVGEWTAWPAGRLPSGRNLASRFGSSTRTVQEALEILRRRGMVQSRPRSGFWRTGDLPAPLRISSRSTASDLSRRLMTEIVEGRHPWDSPLPSIKELALEWGCHVQTASKALEAGIHARLLERRGRRLFPVRPRLGRKAATPHILCVGAAASDGHFRLDSDRESDFWRELGAQATLAGLSLVRSAWSGQKVVPSQDAVGVVATTWHHHDPMAVCRELSRLRIPVCVWVEEHILEGPSLDSRIRFHDQGYSSRIGSIVARHLLDLGHKHLAFFSPWHASQWSRNRLQGIEHEVARNGGKVDAFCLEGESEWDRLIPAETDPVLIRCFPEKALSRIVEGPTCRLRELVVQELGWNRVRRDTEPLLEGALASGATAWIGANDVCALNALKWLREKGVRVPGEISVVGFDDIVEALRSDLTSFRFSYASMARSMIRQILSPSSLSSSLTRHEGMVVARGSSAPAGGRR
jgi:DNA-binding LacI/PurR family transcriptional regulator/DNA-binding transcriptional regulator YhcF (GntR family)